MTLFTGLAAPLRVLVVDDEAWARRNVTVLLEGDRGDPAV